MKVSVSDNVSDLLEKVRDKLTSSAAQIWIVDNEGKGNVRPLDCYSKAHVQHVHVLDFIAVTCNIFFNIPDNNNNSNKFYFHKCCCSEG